jgi:hypothetical protein
MQEPELAQKAQAVLEENWTGSFTCPAQGLYPHQWSWDSAFISFAYAHFNPERAEQELFSLFRGQWNNGLLPHIVFHNKSAKYAPGPEFWQSERSSTAPKGLSTSGIVQPPIHASAALHIYKKAPNKKQARGFLKKIFPKLSAWHTYLYKERDPHNEGLVYIRHPWESGQDNSPIWDSALKRIKLQDSDIPSYKRTDLQYVEADYRPTDESYDRYVYLVKLFCKLNYDEKEIF